MTTTKRSDDDDADDADDDYDDDDDYGSWSIQFKSRFPVDSRPPDSFLKE